MLNSGDQYAVKLQHATTTTHKGAKDACDRKIDECMRRAKDNDLNQRKQLADDQRQAAIIGGLLGLRLTEEDLSEAFQDLLGEGL